MNFSFKTQTLFALVASAILTSGMAVAADAIDVKNVADPGRHPYQQTASLQCSSSPTPCLLVFPAITTARTVVLHASCYIGHVTSQIISFVSLSDSTLQIPSYLPITQAPDSSGGSSGESFNTAVGDPYAFFETGQQPTINVSVLGPQSAVGVQCTLSGYYI
jgi:hypothetical protein